MKQLKISILAIAMLFVGAITTIAQTADEIVQKHVTAMGGMDAWKKVNSLTMTAVMSANGAEIPINMTIVTGKGLKVDYTFSGMTGWSIITDKEGWVFTPFAGQTKPEAMPEESVKQSQDQLDAQGPLIDYQAKGIKLTFLGKDEVEGSECFKLKAVYKSGKEETIYIDATNYYHIRSVTKIKAEGKEMEVTSNMGNFQKLPEGIVYPMSMDNGNGPMTIKTVVVNKQIPEDFFKPKM